MKILEYCIAGEPVNDWLVDQELEKILSSRQENFSYSTANIFNRIRLAVHKDEIDKEAFCFLFDEKILTMNKRGRLKRWPDGFLEQACYLDGMLEEKEEEDG